MVVTAQVGAELRALSEAAPLDLRVNLLKGTRQEALAALRAAGFAAAPTPYSPIGIRLAQQSGTIELGQLPGLLEVRARVRVRVRGRANPSPNPTLTLTRAASSRRTRAAS